MARNPELEQALLANPDDEQSYQVYADWLQAQGDPRGELASLQTGKIDAARRKREQELLTSNRAALLGELPEPADNSELQVVWHAGWLRSVRLAAGEDHSLPDLYRA